MSKETGPPATPANEPEPWSVEDFGPIMGFLRSRIGITLEPHRMGLLQARLRSRLQSNGYPSFLRFFERVLRVDPNGPGCQLLIDLSTVNHTAFFREPAHFTFLCQQLGPAMKAATAPVRVWSAGCSTGQEPYSLAMVLYEMIPNITPQKVEIWASDLSMEVLKTAASAIYTKRDVAGVSEKRLKRFFLLGKGPREGSFRIVPEVRDLVKYRHIDLRNSVWGIPSDFHAILCRNVSIYFAEEERMVLLERLAQSLRPGGWLIMGNGEILPAVPQSLQKHAPSIYRKVVNQ